MKHKEKIQDISTTATNEATLERMLQKVIDLWQTTDFRYIAPILVFILFKVNCEISFPRYMVEQVN